jgi:glycosyltransferase involved in cell wall biosynthesis
MLGRFYTDAYCRLDPLAIQVARVVQRYLGLGVVERFLTRFDEDLPVDKVMAFNGLGAWYYWRRWRAPDTASLAGVHVAAASYFNMKIVKRGLVGAEVVYGCNGASVELFRYARSKGIGCLLEQTIAPQLLVESLLRHEAERWPGWEPGLKVDGNGVLAEREQEEWQLASRIVTGSKFASDGLRGCGVPSTKCCVVPYGVSGDQFVDSSASQGSAKLRVLFVGEIGLRKGVPYLLEALRRLNSRCIEARFVGSMKIEPTVLGAYKRWASCHGPVPRSRIMELFRWADLLVLPSICEGSALVTYEALMSGLPVIVTPNAGAPVEDGVNGLLVPPRDIEALASSIDRFACDREFLRKCREGAATARADLSLEAYGARLLRVVELVAARGTSS